MPRKHCKPTGSSSVSVLESTENFEFGARLPVSSPLMSSEDVESAKGHSRNPNPKVRGNWIRYLLENGPCTWDDLQTWTLDPVEEIRWQVLYAMGNDWDVAGYLCSSDKTRAINILIEAATRYGDMQIGITMRELSEKDAQWLEVTWKAADRLLQGATPQLVSALECGYFEHVIPDNNWGSEDPHIRPWVAHGGNWRKLMLLRIAAYQGMNEGRLRDIILSLARDKDQEIASLAQGMLDGRLSYADMPG